MGMPEIGCTRRGLLRLLAACAAVSPQRPVLAQPPGRKPAPPRRAPLVAIDPGHGGVDPGAVSPSGAYEKTIVLATARELARELAAARRFRTLLTRDGDEFVPLRDRVARARAARADLFLSIHADMLPNPAMRGLSVFTQSAEASDREAAALAIRENTADRVGRVRLSQQPAEIARVLLDLARRQTANLSIALAHRLVVQLGREVVLLDRPQRFADFAVLTAPDIPSALVELGCLSNAREEYLLQQRAYQRRLARALARAVEAYFAAFALR
jgi:N-acetylmuramoyl-L-alanine amidase